MSEKLFDALRKQVQNEPYAKMLGLELVKVERGYALIRMAFSERHHNIYGRCHGGAIFSLIPPSPKSNPPAFPSSAEVQRGISFCLYPRAIASEASRLVKKVQMQGARQPEERGVIVYVLFVLFVQVVQIITSSSTN